MAETKITMWRSQRKEVISWVDQNEREHFQALLLLGYSRLEATSVHNDLERKGQRSFNRWSRHCLPILQDCLTLSSSMASALSGLTFSQMTLIHSSVSSQTLEEEGRGNWGTDLGTVSGWVYGTEGFTAPFQGIHTPFEEYKLQEQVWWDGTSWKRRKFPSSFWQNGKVESRPLELHSRCLHMHWHQDINLHETQVISEEILVVDKNKVWSWLKFSVFSIFLISPNFPEILLYFPVEIKLSIKKKKKKHYLGWDFVHGSWGPAQGGEGLSAHCIGWYIFSSFPFSSSSEGYFQMEREPLK